MLEKVEVEDNGRKRNDYDARVGVVKCNYEFNKFYIE